MGYLLQDLVSLLLVVAVVGRLSIPDPEERGLEDIDVTGEDEVFEVVQEEGEEQVPDVVAILVGIGGDDHPVEAQVLDAVLDAEGHHGVEELFVLVDGGFGLAVDVLRFALEAEDGLGHHVARGDNGTCGRGALGDEDGGLIAVLLVAQMVLAVLEVRDLDGDLPGRLLGFLLDGVELFPETLVLGDLLVDLLGGGRVFVEEVDHAASDLGDDPSPHVGVPQLVLGLGLEDGFLELDRHGPRYSLANVDAAVVLLEELVDPFEDSLAEGGLVGAAVAGVLAVHEGEKGLPVVRGVGE